MTRFVKTLTVLALAITTFVASPATAFDRITANGLAVKGTENSGSRRLAGPTLARVFNNDRAVVGAERNGETTTLDSQSLRVIGIELPR
jgi:hypothetical protein